MGEVELIEQYIAALGAGNYLEVLALVMVDDCIRLDRRQTVFTSYI